LFLWSQEQERQDRLDETKRIRELEHRYEDQLVEAQQKRERTKPLPPQSPAQLALPDCSRTQEMSSHTQPTEHTWSEHYHHGTRRPYFHNATTGQTVWDKPAVLNASTPATSLPTPQPTQAPTAPTTAPSGPIESALSYGWSEHYHHDSRRPYFHNATTGETAWERPTAPGTPIANAVVFQPQPPSPMPSPAPAPTMPSQRLRQASTPAPPLPHGWQEHFQEGTGRPYFHNAVTQEAVWERPSFI
jgi:hypothetical protein